MNSLSESGMAPSGELPYRPVLEQTLRHALSYLNRLYIEPVGATATLQSLRESLHRALPESGLTAECVIDELVRDTAPGLIGSSGGRFFGWVIGGTLPAALAADWLTSTWDQNAAIYACSPAEAVVEEIAGEWLKQIFGLPADAGFAFVTGCQMAHFTCLSAARHTLLARRGWDVERDGLTGAPSFRVISSGERHGSVVRALRMLGIENGCMVELPCDDAGRLAPDTLRDALSAPSDDPTIVLLQAGDLNIGGYDPFEELVPIAHAKAAWVHVDGAFGLWAAASPKHRHLLNGVDAADSWATDGHKWLNVPYDSGYAFVSNASLIPASLSYRANYITTVSDGRDQIDWNPEWSRRGRGVASYAALRQLGRDGLAELIERTCQYAADLVEGIGALDGAEVVWTPQINQGLVRFLDNRPGATNADHDRRTDEVIAEVVACGEAYFGGTTWRGMRCMRISVCSWQTTSDDVTQTIKAVHAAIQNCRQ
ncbi:MAG: aminotransferase class V-fold PLP-dependent enzyme [Thermomicrobiales bacterium]|nr:aminotransferase class V-fold PLP-dependent enzyme [Thermomicrobiales bacterium]